MSAHWKPLSLILVAAALAGCASQKEETRPTVEQDRAAMEQEQGQPDAQQMHARMCPMEVPGATVKAEDVDNGVALVFTTTDPAQVEELRSRVQHLAMMHGQGGGMHGHGHGHGHGKMHGNMQGQPGGCPACGAHAMGKATAEPVEGGARLKITVDDPAQLERVRARVREHAGQMQEGQCPMMGALGREDCPHMKGGQCPMMRQGAQPAGDGGEEHTH